MSRTIWPLLLTLLLTLCPVGSSQGTPEWVGDRDAMAGELTAMSPYGNSPWVEYPIDWAFGEASVSAKISMRYRLWKLVGEAVWTFEPKYELEMVKFGPSSVRPDPRLPSGAVQGDLRPDGSTIIRVAEDVFQKIRIRDLSFSTRLTQLAPDRSTVYQNGWATAVFDRPGEWGWDVPGSPPWDKALTTERDPALGDAESTNWIEKDAAKDTWTRLETAWETNRAQPLEGLRCARVHVSVSSLLARLERISPGVTRPLFSRFLRGETPEQAAQRNEREYQVQALLNGVSRALEAAPSAANSETVKGTLERRLAVTERAFLLLPDSRSDGAKELDDARKQLAGAALESRIAALAPSLQSELPAQPEEPLPKSLQLSIQAILQPFDQAPVVVSAALSRRIDALRSLTRNAGWRVVAEWQSPRPTAGFEDRGVVELKGFETGEDGRAVALFQWGEPRSLGDKYQFVRAWAVDALTGEVIKTEPESRDEQAGIRSSADYWLWGDAHYLVTTEWEFSGVVYGIPVNRFFDLQAKSYVEGPEGSWFGGGTGYELIAQFESGELVCWDTVEGNVRWRADAGATDWLDYEYRVSVFHDELVLCAWHGLSGFIIDLKTGEVLLDVQTPNECERFGGSIGMDDLEAEAELLRPQSEPSPGWDPATSLPPEYQFAFAEWPYQGSVNSSHDAVVVLKPGQKDTGRGGMTYQLLTR